MERGLDLADAVANMVRESKSGLGQVYEADSEAAFGEADSLRDYKLYRAGFALTVAAISGTLVERGEPMPSIPDDPFTVRRYVKLTSQWQDDSTQYDLKLALLRDERQLVEAVDAAAPIDPQDNRWGADYIPLFDGAVAAYLALSEAEAQARHQQLNNEATGFVGQLATVDILR